MSQRIALSSSRALLHMSTGIDLCLLDKLILFLNQMRRVWEDAVAYIPLHFRISRQKLR